MRRRQGGRAGAGYWCYCRGTDQGHPRDAGTGPLTESVKNGNGRNRMKYVLSISAALLLTMTQWQPASAQGQAGNNLVNEAVKAQGGADALRALKGVAISGEAKYC